MFFLGQNCIKIKIVIIFALAKKATGCSSARLEYASGGRVVAGSNPVIPTYRADSVTNVTLFLFSPMDMYKFPTTRYI